MVRAYLHFLDHNVLLKKPISCLYALLSLSLPFGGLYLLIQFSELLFNNGRMLFGAILIFLILLLAGCLGALIWWHRRLARNTGASLYLSFRSFILTLGEWTGTLTAILGFGFILIFALIFNEGISLISTIYPIPISGLQFYYAFGALVLGFLIILGTRILIFIIDLLAKLLKSIWTLLLRIILYYYRCIVKIHRTIELNTSVWIGVVWLFSAVTVVFGLVLSYRLLGSSLGTYLLGLIPLFLGLGFMAFLVMTRKKHDA